MIWKPAAWAVVVSLCLGRPAAACELTAWPPMLRKPSPSIEPDGLRWLALTAWAESRGEGFCGLVAVSHVILNRLRSGNYGTTVRQVTRAPWQFSVWNDGGAVLGKVSERDPAYLMAQLAAASVATGAVADNTGGATHFHTVTMKPRPTWAGRMVVTARIGGHVFYRGKHGAD